MYNYKIIYLFKNYYYIIIFRSIINFKLYIVKKKKKKKSFTKTYNYSVIFFQFLIDSFFVLYSIDLIYWE